MSELTDKLKAAKARTAGTVVAAKPRPKAYRLKAEDNDAVKALLFGHSGTGKTFFLVGILLAGERVVVLSSDFGSNGLVTVKNELRKRGKLDLLNNLVVVDVSTFDEIVGFFDNAIDYMPDLNDFNPTVIVWEGFTSFNVDILDEYILSMAPGADGAGEMRKEGWTHTKQDWQGHKRGTIRTLRRFLAWTPESGKKIHKLLTCLESKPEINELSSKTQRGPLVHGTGRDLMNVGFDVVMQTFKEETKETGVIQHFYRFSGASDKFVVKSRGFDLQPIEPAEPERIWSILSGKVTNGEK